MTTETHPTTAPRRPALSHREAMRLAATEYDRMASTLADLEADHWSLPTDCPDWDVRQLAAHMVGMTAMAASPLESARQQKLAAREHERRGGPMVDSLTAVQVAERAGRTPAQLVAEARKVAPRGARGRRLTPAFLRRRPFPESQVVNGVEEQWTLGYLLDVILTRDPWMHRIDLARATGQSLHLTADHDGVIVADVVEEWAGRHGQPYDLELTGPAGGRWRSTGTTASAPLSLDAIEFCQILSGRLPGEGLLAVQVPF